MIFVVTLLMGVVAGLRAMTPLAAASWAAHLGWVSVAGTPLAFMGNSWTPWVFTVLAVAELITDQLPQTPSRKVPVQFGARLVSGALAGATLAIGVGALIPGIVLGIVGAVAGTYGGAAARGKLAARFGKDLPAALIEDAVAVLGALALIHFV
jgi:uncharacterized membrane protein